MKGLNKPSKASRHEFRRPAAMLVIVSMLLFMASASRAGSIFDDDGTLPAPAKPETPGPVAPPAPETTTPDAPRTRPADAPQAAIAEAPHPRTRRPIPTPAQRAKSRALFKEVYAKELADTSPAARRALAEKLLAQAATVADAPSDEFVLLTGAAAAGKEASDLSLCCRAGDALADAYDIDAVRFKSDLATTMALRAAAPDLTAGNCRAGLKLVDQVVAAEDYRTASRLLFELREASPDAGLNAQIQSRVREVDSLRAAAERIAPQLQKLKTAPNDPLANLMVGRYFCFTKGDWKRGLPLLAKGGKTPESAAAALELAGASDPAKQVEAGDAWWNAAEREAGPTQLALRQRAASLYGTALQSPTISGLKRVLLEKRVAGVTPGPQAPVAASAVTALPEDPAKAELRRALLTSKWGWNGPKVKMTFHENGTVNHIGMHGTYEITGPRQLVLHISNGDKMTFDFNDDLTHYTAVGRGFGGDRYPQ